MAALPVASINASPSKNSSILYAEQASNELVFAVVGHVGSGTSDVAETLMGLLQEGEEPFNVSILKAKDEIVRWTQARGLPVPTLPPPDTKPNLDDGKEYQRLGDKMRETDLAAVAKALIVHGIRPKRAELTNVPLEVGKAVLPDEKRRAYIIDSIRHPAEVELFRSVYQGAFFLIGVVCDESVRERRLTKKYRDGGEEKVRAFMKTDEHEQDRNGQRVSEAFHLADLFVDNTQLRYLGEDLPNPAWDVDSQLRRLIKIITASEVVRPTVHETAMHAAAGAQVRSGCLSRQVGAAIVDKSGVVLATGGNEVPKAGGGVYGEELEYDPRNDHRCAFRKTKFCSNTVEQKEIIEELIKEFPALQSEKDVIARLQKSRIGQLLEFSRAVHAEMAALLAATRKGNSTIGTRLYVTTFPCHYCARHIVASGVDEVQFIEPYPKSQALKLHNDSICKEKVSTKTTDGKTEVEWRYPSDGGQHVLFRPFTGVAPRLYSRAFLKDRELKNKSTGAFQIGHPEWGDMWYLGRASYAQMEAILDKEGV